MSDQWDEIIDAALTVSKDGGSRLARLVLAADDRIKELEAKLAKTVEALQNIAGKVPYADDPWDIACAALKELKEQTNDQDK